MSSQDAKVLDKYLRKPRQIDEGQTQDMWGVYLEVDRLSVDPLVIARYSCSLIFDFPLDVLKLCESSVGYMVEFGPFRLRCYS